MFNKRKIKQINSIVILKKIMEMRMMMMKKRKVSNNMKE